MEYGLGIIPGVEHQHISDENDFETAASQIGIFVIQNKYRFSSNRKNVGHFQMNWSQYYREDECSVHS